mmetsp:Transcript_60491/g.107807  ORF Transcript_60491/g.107807 Transcript_60491/m.107807 type:complete len:517 (+) Transcript_60491:61-1611(+)
MPSLKALMRSSALLVFVTVVLPSNALPHKRQSPSTLQHGPLSLSGKKAGNLNTHLRASKQPVGGVTETEYQNWFSRMGDAFISVVVGILLIIFSIPCMWVNERRAARFESLIKVGESECISVGHDKAKDDNRGRLVHVSGANAEGKKPLQDERFASFKLDSKCLKIVSSVEAYQWVQKETKEKRRDNMGGGETTVTTYTYSKAWKGERIDSKSFKERGYENRLAKMEISLGVMTKTCSVVHYGEAFQLPEEMVNQLDNYEDASPIIGSQVQDFTKHGEYYYFPSKRTSEPQVGDMRVTFKYIPDGPVTALGLQVEDPKLQRDSLLPFRLVSRGYCCCAASEEQVKSLQIKEGKKSPDDLYADDKVNCGPLDLCFYCCVGICNIVTYFFSGLAPPQVYHLFAGDLDVAACWKKIAVQAGTQKWMLRVVAWLMMLMGLMMCFQPVFTAIDIIPFLGKYLSSFVWLATFICAFVLTLAISALVMSLAYLIYRPLLGLFYLAMTAAGVVGTIMIINAVKG